MLAPSGEVLAINFEGNGWFRTENALFYVHRGQPWALTRRERLAVSRAAELPADAARVPEEAVTPFMITAADCVEAFAEVAE